MPPPPPLATIAALALDLACGRRCAGCGRGHVATPCDDCRHELERSPRPRGGAWLDEGVAARLVRAGKHGTWRGAGRALARLLVRRVELGGVGAVTWVPADRRRRARRGGCLPEAVALQLARELGVPAVCLLRRAPGSRSQRGRTRHDRIANVRHAYQLLPDAPARLTARSVLLVDDVRTTGATLGAASRELHRLGVEVLPLALVAVDRTLRQQQKAVDFAESPQRARNFRSRPVSVLPIRWGTTTERQSQDLNAPRPP